MIKKIIMPAFFIVAIVIGGVGADFLRGGQSETGDDNKASSNTLATDTSHAKPKKKKPKKDSHGKSVKSHDKGAKSAGSLGANTYMKFKRQFVVPVMQNGKIESLVLLNLNLELNGNAPSNPYALEPKLRDAIMRELLALSHAEVFSNDLTSAETYDRLRASLLSATRHVITDGVENVLILDLARQDQ